MQGPGQRERETEWRERAANEHLLRGQDEVLSTVQQAAGVCLSASLPQEERH